MHIPYQFYTPSIKESVKVPLVIHLHGTGESGTDNEAQMYIGWWKKAVEKYGEAAVAALRSFADVQICPTCFASKVIQDIAKAYVMAPQTPKGMRWASTSLDEYDFQKTPSNKSMTALLALTEKLIKENSNINEKRIYDRTIQWRTRRLKCCYAEAQLICCYCTYCRVW